jgi:hypothetical protein
MTARLSIVFVLAGIAAAYALGATPTAAQSVSDVPFTVGDRLTLTFDYAGQPLSSTIECTVVELQPGFVRCAPGDRFKTGRDEVWYSLRPVVRIVKHEK